MTEAKIKESGAGDQLLPGTETRTSAKNVSESDHLNVCPECGGPLRFGSRGPCEGDYYWCRECGAGPFLFPLYERPKKPVPAIIDAEIANEALRIIAALKPVSVREQIFQKLADIRAGPHTITELH